MVTTSICFFIIDLPSLINYAVSVSIIPFLQFFGQVDALVPGWKTLEDAKDLVAMFLIEVWRLKTECVQISIPGTTLPCFLFSRQ